MKPVIVFYIHRNENSIPKKQLKIENVKQKKNKKKQLSYPYFAFFTMKLGNNCIQNIHLGKYIVRYRVGSLVICKCIMDHQAIICIKSDDLFH